MSRTEEAVTQVRHQQGEESLIIPDGFRLDTEQAIIRQEGERLVVIPLREPPAGDRHAHHAPKPRPDQSTAMPLTHTPLKFEVIGGPYPRFGSWTGRLQRLWARAAPSAVHERVRDRAWHEGFEAGRSSRAGTASSFPWLERFKARLATGEPIPSPDRPEGERLALELLELRKGD